jgi:hypothetical protein
MPVEVEYCLSTKDLRIRGAIAPRALDKIHAALSLAEPLPQLLGTTDDGPGAPVVEALLATASTPLPVPIMDGADPCSGGTPP